MTGNGESVREFIKRMKPSMSDILIQQIKGKAKLDGYPESGYKKIIRYASIKLKGNELNNYDIRTYELLENFLEGYCVSFQVNCEIGVMGDYTDIEYDYYVYEMIDKTDVMPHIGYYCDVPETSFNCKCYEIAIGLMKKYNQCSIFDNKNQGEIFNEDYIWEINPTYLEENDNDR